MCVCRCAECGLNGRLVETPSTLSVQVLNAENCFYLARCIPERFEKFSPDFFSCMCVFFAIVFLVNCGL